VSEQGHQPIFFDGTRRRWGVFTALVRVLTVVCVVAALAFSVSIARNPRLPGLTLAGSLGLYAAPTKGAQTDGAKLPPDAPTRARARFLVNHDAPVREATRRLAEAIKRESKAQPIPATAIAPGHVAGPVRAAFFSNDDKPALDSLTQHIGQITHLFPVWLLLNADSVGVKSIADFSTPSQGEDVDEAHSDTNDDIALKAARQDGVAILPTVQNYDSDPNVNSFDFDRLHKMLASPALRRATITGLLKYVQAGRYQGINIDFETDREDDQDDMTAFMTELASAFHPRGLLVTQDVQLDSDAYDLPTLARVTDFLIPMLYDQHSDGTEAGPIAGQSWYEQELHDFMAQVPANKVVIGLGNYSYDWTAGQTQAKDLAFQDAARFAQESRDGEDGVIKIDQSSLNPYFTYWDDSQGQDSQIKHTVWIMDATTAYNEMLAAEPYHTLGAAMWQLGSEDPSLWSFYGKDSAASLAKFDPQNLSKVIYNGFETHFDGRGDVLDIVRQPTDGKRRIVVDPQSGHVTGESFLSYPSQWVIRRTGLVDQATGKNTAKKIALTFDDGPDPRWTPQILDILEREHVPATFFVVGENAEAHPGLIAREWNEGMEIGNHSFTHPEQMGPLRTKLELDATQRVIEAVTGHMTTLFRAPNRADSEPATEADFAPIWQSHLLGYLFIGESNDPTDWLPGITSSQIVKSVMDYVDNPKHDDTKDNGNCILLHDAGGDTRAETVKALPQIIDRLKAEGYTFVPVSALIGKPKSVVFPAVTGKQRWTVAFDRLFFDVTYWMGNGLTALFLIVITLGIGRILVMGVLASRQAKREALRTFDPTYRPSVSVVIAAFNEAKVINKTIQTLLDSDYPDLDIVVVDDGSKDDTAGVVRQTYGAHPRVSILTKPNGGKASALNLGIKECRGEIIVSLDADTMFAPDTVAKLVRHFADPAIGAVSGNVKVGNRSNPLTIWQAVEYITSQNFDRRAFDLLNCITVVPGAVGAWRKDAVVLAGLYSSQTLAEDTDLTFKVRRLGYRIVTDNAALAYTEAPDTIRDLAKQRFRWAFGTLQCLWKHRTVLFNPRYGAFGLVALPSLWVFQIGFQAIAPIVDFAIAWSLIYGTFITPIANHRDVVTLLGYWAVFSTVELAGAWLAFRLDREDKRLLAWLPLQRFVYRQLMYYVIVKSLVVAVRGSLVGWGKFERKGTVKVIASTPKEDPALKGRAKLKI
jgi:cellulose synthase/poly-beta-1,6-N-acetylglucosamine synthase-like glycosyltransferase/peptidoglycan/xylan/chitin deacetylase (PgdA/CDA1 family)/spore germination protein YaaH